MKAKEVEILLLEMINNKELVLLNILTDLEQNLKNQCNSADNQTDSHTLPALQKLMRTLIDIEFDTWESHCQKQFRGNPEHYWLAKQFAIDLNVYLSKIESVSLTFRIHHTQNLLARMDAFLNSMSSANLDFNTNSLGQLIILHSRLKIENQELLKSLTDALLPQEQLRNQIETMDIEIENIRAAGELKVFETLACKNREKYSEYLFNPPSSIFLQGFKMVDNVNNINNQMTQVCQEIQMETEAFKVEIMRLIDENPKDFICKIDMIDAQISTKIAILNGEILEAH